MDMKFPRGTGTQLKKSWKFQGIGDGETVKPPGSEQNPGREVGVKLNKTSVGGGGGYEHQVF